MTPADSILRLSAGRGAAFALAACLAGCAHTDRVDWSHPSANQDSRVQFLVIHATEIDFRSSLRVLTHGDVSSHYLVDRDGHVYGLVPEDRRAWHAGPSYWEGSTPLNPSSIGIEIVSVPAGEPEGTDVPFPAAQVTAVTALVADIARRHQIRPNRIVGHGEVQPEGRTDPGHQFPWTALAEHGLVAQADPAMAARYAQQFGQAAPTPMWIQEHLSMQGYNVRCTGVLDAQTHHVLAVFQGRYRQRLWDGTADAETLGLLAALTDPAGRQLKVNGQWQAFHADPAPRIRCEHGPA